MAQFNYEDYANKKSSKGKGGSKKDFKVSFFSLTGDGDEAVVRFPYTSPKEFETVTVHRVKVGKTKAGKDLYKSVSCLKENYFDDDSKCPLCALGEDNKAKSKFYCRVLVYEKDESGNVVPKAKIWERPLGFANLLSSYFTEYGDISNHVFKIKRKGEAGSKETSYEVIYANAAIYKPEVYVKDFKDFEGYTPEGSAYLTKTEEEMKYFVETGEFPEEKKATKKETKTVLEEVAQPTEETPTESVAKVEEQTPSAPAPKKWEF